METEVYLNTYFESSEVMYYLFYQLIEIHGIKYVKEERGIRCTENDVNPDLFSAFAVNIDGTSTCIADASLSKLEELRDLAKKLSTKFGWDFNDHTQTKDYSRLNDITTLYCPKCGNETEMFHEGYCEDCCQNGQLELNEHIARYDSWQRLSDQDKDSAIKAACIL